MASIFRYSLLASILPVVWAWGDAAFEAEEQWNTDFGHYTLIVCGGAAGVALILRLLVGAYRRIRLLTSIDSETQGYWLRPSTHLASLKKHLVYAPVFSVRHNREFNPVGSLNFGTLPTRFEFLFLAAYIATNMVFCVVHVDYTQGYSNAAGIIRNRAGALAVANMIPLFILATRNNPLIKWLDLSFDTFNLLHRWIGRLIAFDVLVHVAMWASSELTSPDPYYPDGILAGIRGSKFDIYGLVGGSAFIAIVIQAWSPIRHAFYESFKTIHILLVIMSIVGVWKHTKLGELAQINYVYAVIAIWVAERLSRSLRLIYRNLSKEGTTAVVEKLPGDAVRVTVFMARPWKFEPGQHAYLYMPSVSFTQSHPFSVAWSEAGERPGNNEKGLVMNRQDIHDMQQTSMSFVIRGRTGFTRALSDRAAKQTSGKFTTLCFVEGPYAGSRNQMDSYGTVVLFAGGVGITHQVPFIRSLLQGMEENRVATRKICLIWTIQRPEHIQWIQPWLSALLSMPKAKDALQIMVFISQPASTSQIFSFPGIQIFPGRPSVGTLLDTEIASQIGAMGVSVCGPGGLGDEVRCAIRMRQHITSIDFIEEAFSW